MLASMPTGNLRLYLNGVLKTEGPMEALGNPAQRVGWLASTVGGLKAGMLVFFGSPAAATPAEVGTMEVVDTNGNSLVVKITN